MTSKKERNLSNTTADAAIRAIEAQFVENANAKNPAKLVHDFYADDALLIPPGSPANTTGTKALVDFWTGLLIQEKAEQIAINTISVEASGDMAYEIGEFGYSSPNDKGVLTRTTGKFVVVYRMIAGRYRATVDIFNVNQ